VKAWIVLAAAALAAAGTALALPDRHPRDPREAFTAADQAWAKRVALKRTDLTGTWRASGPTPAVDARCASFDPDMSDLTLTGKSESQDFTRGTTYAGSLTEIFRTARETATSFRRAARPQLIRCYDELVRAEFPSQAKVELVSGRVVAAPKVGERRFALRMIWEITVGVGSVRSYLDVLGWDRGRASTAVFLSTIDREPDRALERRIVQRLDARMRE
jgi:hypothetical protein